jgi:hypothetical protein
MESLLETEDAGNAATTDESSATKTTAETKPTVDVVEQPKEETKPEPPKREGAPEKYDFRFPDGVPIDKGMLSEFEVVLREADIPQKHAEKLVGFGIKMQELSAKAYSETTAAREQAWRAEAEKLPEFAKDKVGATKASILAFLRDDGVLGKAGTDALMTALGETGIGSHPGLLKTLHRAAQAHAEDVAVLGGRAQDTKVGAKAFYDKSDHV